MGKQIKTEIPEGHCCETCRLYGDEKQGAVGWGDGWCHESPALVRKHREDWCLCWQKRSK